MSEQKNSSRETATRVADSHEIDLDFELSQGFAAKFIRRKAKQLVGRAGFRSADRPDLEQEMKLRVLMRFPKFDPEKSNWDAFVTTIVKRHVATILEKARRLKRHDGGTHRSLSELVEDCDGVLVELGDTIGADDKGQLTGCWVDSAENLSDLKLDVESLMDDLPEDLRELCELLKHHTITEAADALGVPRTTASSMLSRIRQRFIDAGFEDFLPNPSSPGAQTR